MKIKILPVQTRRAVTKQIAKLIQQGFIERIGSRKNGYWNLLTNKQD
jgi:predicted HTH transcriptional regulator